MENVARYGALNYRLEDGWQIEDTETFCVFLSLDEFDQLYAENIAGSQEMVYYVTFHRFCNISKTIQEITDQLGLEKVPYDVGINASTGSGEELVICSEEMFGRLVPDVQLYSGTTDAEVQEIRKMMEEACGEGMVFSDKRIGNQEAKGASYSMSVFLYGFLAVIALIGFFNIINCVAMSVSARLREYGAMRAIGISMRQLFYMVLGEALTYIGLGAAVGCAVGFPINRLLFQSLVTERWGTAWTFPGWELLVILAVMLGAVCLAVTGPAKQIRKMTVMDTISMR